MAAITTKPVRGFTAGVGDYSKANAGPEKLVADLDEIFRMFDPASVHPGGNPGGIGPGNIQPGGIDDIAIGNLTPDPTIATVFTGVDKLSVILSWMAKMIVGITGQTNWYTAANITIAALNTLLGTTITSIDTKDTAVANTAANALLSHRIAGILDHPDLSVTNNKIAPNAITADKIDPSIPLTNVAVGTLAALIYGGVPQYPAITFGMNTRITGLTTEIFPKTTVKGLHYVNWSGRDGNCEDTSKWLVTLATIALDPTTKVYGNNSFKLTLTSTIGGFYKTAASLNLDTSKYYLIYAFIKNGNATNAYIVKDNSGGGNNVASNVVTDTTKFNQVGIVVRPSDFGTANNICIYASGASTQYANIDGIMIKEITPFEYTQGPNVLMPICPYGESYVCTQNLYAENRRGNLVDNGNGEKGAAGWTSYNGASSTSVINSKLQFTATAAGQYSGYLVNVKPNTNYSFSGNLSGTGSPFFNIASTNFGYSFRTGVGTFNTGLYSQLVILAESNTAGTVIWDSIMLVEGTIAPPAYIAGDKQAWLAEGSWTSDDTLMMDGDKPGGSRWWKHNWAIYGRDYTWLFVLSRAGFKFAYAVGVFPVNIITGSPAYVIKFDGKPLRYDGGASVLDTYINYGSDGASPGCLGIALSNADSGTIDAINPNGSELAAIMNGYRALTNNGTRYTSFVSMVDGSIPAGAISTLTTGTSNAGQAVLNVTAGTGTSFVNGDVVAVERAGVLSATYTVSSSAANTITFTTNLAGTYDNTYSVMKCDNPAVSTPLLTWCTNNIAPGFPGYQFHYKLAAPEAITDKNCIIHGDPWTLLNGVDNYPSFDTGIVSGEIANLVLNNTSDAYGINVINHPSYPNANVTNALKYRTESIIAVYKNGVLEPFDTAGISGWQQSSANANGNMRISRLATGVDPNAIYTVDYQIIRTQVPQIVTSIAFQYSQDMVSAIAANGKSIEGCQLHDSSFDNLRDTSMNDSWPFASWMVGRAVKINTADYRLFQSYKFPTKKSIPKVIISNDVVYQYDGAGGSLLLPKSAYTLAGFVANEHVTFIFTYIGADTTVRTNILNNGVGISFSVVFDCKGVIQ